MPKKMILADVDTGEFDGVVKRKLLTTFGC